MAFHIETPELSAGGKSATVYRLASEDGLQRAEVWPSHGMNCLRWRADGSELLFVHPDWEATAVPTRSATPVLFPFPNRIRDGKFEFNGTKYELPLNDSAKANAIHGFAPRNEWAVVSHAATDEAAEVVGRFRLSEQVPEALPLWPGDCSLSSTVRLEPSRLRLISRVENHSDKPVPFGLGFHPYFRLPTRSDGVDEYRLRAAVEHEWELRDNLPTGAKKMVEPDLRSEQGVPLAGRDYDSLFGGVTAPANPDGLRSVCALSHEEAGRLEVLADANFDDWIIFTPPHRGAVALEPYTCPTDAINLEKHGTRTGWRVLGVGESWKGLVEFRWSKSG